MSNSIVLQSMKNWLDTSRVIQIATSDAGKPWICTVYFVADDEMNVYWLSLPSRRHSKEIANNDHVAAAVAIKQDQPVIGLQIEGIASQIHEDKTIQKNMEVYVAKYGTGNDFYPNFKAGVNKHEMYRLKPISIILFDEVHHPENPRQKFEISDLVAAK